MIDIGKTDEKSIERFPHKTAEEFLSGLVHKKVAAVVCRQNRIAPGETAAQAGVGKIRACIRMLADFRVKITGPNILCHAGVPMSILSGNFWTVTACAAGTICSGPGRQARLREQTRLCGRIGHDNDPSDENRVKNRVK